ncbi:unnamed protein product, partial [Didymodactylos carnosus]
KIIDFLEEKVIKEENWCLYPSASPKRGAYFADDPRITLNI